MSLVKTTDSNRNNKMINNYRAMTWWCETF